MLRSAPSLTIIQTYLWDKSPYTAFPPAFDILSVCLSFYETVSYSPVSGAGLILIAFAAAGIGN